MAFGCEGVKTIKFLGVDLVRKNIFILDLLFVNALKRSLSPPLKWGNAKYKLYCTQTL